MITLTEIFEHYEAIRQSLAHVRLTRWQITKLLAAQVWRDSSTLGRIIIVATLVYFLQLVLSRLLRPRSLRRLGIPSAAKKRSYWSRLDFKQVLEDTAVQTPDSPFLLDAFGVEYVVFPSRCFDEIKRLPESKASAFAFFREAFHGAWTGAGVQTPELGKTVAVELTRAIPSLVRSRQKDCAVACDKAIGNCPDWKEVLLYSTMQDLVSSINSCAFVGRELGASQKWIRTVDSMPMLLAIPTFALSYVPVILRPLAKPIFFAPFLWVRRTAKRMLLPVLLEDMKEYYTSKDKKSLLGPKENGKVQLTGWLLDRYKDKVKQKVMADLVQDYITLIFEATPSSALTLFFVVCELAADTKLQEILRQELEETTVDGVLPQTHLNELRKMDSVMRESARVNGFSNLVLYRKLLAPTKLSLGPELPRGSNICVDAHHINFSRELWGDKPGPEVFDGLRHYRAREVPGEENRFKFANLGRDAPGWGDGLQACPGRMFADNTIKIALTHLLRNYDFKLRPGETKPKKGAMPNGSTMPDLRAKILFKSRASHGGK